MLAQFYLLSPQEEDPAYSSKEIGAVLSWIMSR